VIVSGDTEFDLGCENGKESNDEMRGGEIEARPVGAGIKGDVIPISGSTMTGDVDCLFAEKGSSGESSTTDIRDWQ
jgi:hypothetical protein